MAKRNRTKPAAPAADNAPPPSAPSGRIASAGVLGAEFAGDLPEHAESGFYQPTVRDRWADETIDLADGEHVDAATGWRFVIAEGRLRHAQRIGSGTA